MIKIIFFIPFIFSSFPVFTSAIIQKDAVCVILNDKERKLTEDEVKERGIDILIGELLETADQEVLKKMARSSIFETNYGFRWKMINTISGEIVIIKVDKNFKLIELKSKGLY